MYTIDRSYTLRFDVGCRQCNSLPRHTTSENVLLGKEMARKATEVGTFGARIVGLKFNRGGDSLLPGANLPASVVRYLLCDLRFVMSWGR